jgi:hypothetical protein
VARAELCCRPGVLCSTVARLRSSPCADKLITGTRDSLCRGSLSVAYDRGTPWYCGGLVAAAASCKLLNGTDKGLVSTTVTGDIGPWRQPAASAEQLVAPVHPDAAEALLQLLLHQCCLHLGAHSIPEFCMQHACWAEQA